MSLAHVGELVELMYVYVCDDVCVVYSGIVHLIKLWLAEVSLLCACFYIQGRGHMTITGHVLEVTLYNAQV